MRENEKQVLNTTALMLYKASKGIIIHYIKGIHQRGEQEKNPIKNRVFKNYFIILFFY